MWRSKKFIIIALLTVVVLAGTIGGVAIAQADDQNNAQATSQNATGIAKLWDKFAEILQKNTGSTVTAQDLQKAFNDARTQIATDARSQYLQKLVQDGKITQDQLDAYNKWLEARPQFPTDAYKKWTDSRPDIPYLFGNGSRGGMMPFGGGPRGSGKMGGMFGGGFHGWRAPAPPVR
jgi:hypothetical protein